MIELNRRHMLKALVALGGASILNVPAVYAQAENLVITTYGGSWEKFWRDTLVPGFTKETGIEPTLDIGLGRTYMTNLRAAGTENPPYSCLMTNEIYATVLRSEGYFEELDLAKLPNYADLYPVATEASKGWAAVGLISPIGLGYRSDMVSTPPTSWKDLWENPEFKGRIGLYNIKNSAGKMFLMLTSMMYGKGMDDLDTGFEMLKELGPVYQTDFNMSTAMATGEIAIAPFDFGEIARLRNQGLPVDCTIPAEGLMMWDQTFNICKNTPARDAAYQYLDFVLSPVGQDLLMREFFVSPVNKTVTVPEDLARDVPVSGAAMDQFIAWDWDLMNDNAEEISRRWNEIFGA
ncbi:ABC transporter substrate-binding protein [Pseudooceanicola spongiae]|uniref:Extracellular solute-binding protein n=1 Tax=Pseudooceanicola spongiae TaxID=2613965 RepID=A0A7L9WKJ2_9RHOB|nr:ABC transporter substrate-binding protein [Pseudooceanicola spongiae]QOL79906.1 extracellular solute-binding protein [Pseudooceanicola spongiae]